MTSPDPDRLDRAIAARLTATARATLACFGTLALGTLPGCRGCAVRAPCAQDQDTQAAALAVAIDGYLYALDHPAREAAPFFAPSGPPVVIAQAPPAPVAASPADLRALFGGRVPDEAVVVPAAVVLRGGEFQERARAVPWPSEFVMEKARDRRALHDVEDRNLRHQIDWHRPGSYVEPMPNLDALVTAGNPYHGAVGIGAAIAQATFDLVQARREVTAGDITPAALRAAGAEDTAYNKTCVRDALRDLALFGLVKRWRGKNTVFTLAV